MNRIESLFFTIAISLIIPAISACGSDSDEWMDPDNPEYMDDNNNDDIVDYSQSDVIFEDGVYENESGTIRLIVESYNIVIQRIYEGQVQEEKFFTYFIKNGIFNLYYNNKLSLTKPYKKGEGITVLGNYHKIN